MTSTDVESGGLTGCDIQTQIRRGPHAPISWGFDTLLVPPSWLLDHWQTAKSQTSPRDFDSEMVNQLVVEGYGSS